MAEINNSLALGLGPAGLGLGAGVEDRPFNFNNQTGPQQFNPWQKFGIGVNAFTGLAGALSAIRNLRLQKDQFNFSKGLANRNLANSAATVNNQLGNQADMAAQLTTGAEFGSDAFQAERARRFNPVDGSPIG